MIDPEKNIKSVMPDLIRHPAGRGGGSRIHTTPDETGFTLLEIIISLVIAGLMVSVVGLLMTVGVQEYVSSKENVALAQKASLALVRIEKEIRGLTAVDAGSSDATCIRYKLETVSPYYRALGVNGQVVELKILPDADCDCTTEGNILVDQVSGFLLSYEDQSGDPPVVASAPPASLSDLSEIRMTLTLDHAFRSIQKTFDIRINPRNNGNLNSPGVNF